MTTIGLVRHGVTDWNEAGRIQGQTDIALNDEGKGQAERLAQRLQQKQWDVIVSSDLARAMQTAMIIKYKLAVPIVTEARLREVNFGLVEGTTLAERIARWGQDWREREVGREKQAQIDERISAAFADILDKYEGGKILIVSHGALIINCLRLFVPELDTSERLTNASLTLLNYTNGLWTCSLYNCTDHLNYE